MRLARSHLGARSGFTLIEAIVSLVVIAVLSTVSSGLIFAAHRFGYEAYYRSILHEQASLALTRISGELRAIPITSATPTITPDISSVTASSITWNGGTCSLTLSGGSIVLTENGATARQLLDNVTAFSISCFDDSNAALAATLNSSTSVSVRRIAISITVSGGGLTETIASRVYLRNTMAGGGV